MLCMARACFTVTLLLNHMFASGSENSVDQVCRRQSQQFLTEIYAGSFISEFKFTNETKKSVLLSWSTRNKESLILVSTNTKLSTESSTSNIYMSKDAGATFKKITDSFDKGNIYISREIGLQRNPHNPDHILIVSIENSKNYLWISKHDGEYWTKYEVPFIFGDVLHFHPNQTDWGVTLSSGHTLYGTKDGGMTWSSLQNNVEKFAWSSHVQDPVGTIYLLRRGYMAATFNIGVSFDLLKYQISDNTKKVIRTNVWQFSAHGQFLYVSELEKNSINRYMKVSTDGGKTFEEVQLMSITPDRFYSVMDMSEGLIFMHVDNPGNTGHGDLYTSGAKGVLYSKSLERHLYPNFPSVSDFYRVLSMRGTYITTQMNADKSMHTVISFNRGAEWGRIRKPGNVDCQKGILSCGLQISSLYSKISSVKTHVPLSSKYASGIILVHGHTHATLQTTAPDVYVSSDGGYNWNRALIGPHRYQIADHGGLLVAVPDVDQSIVKFSTDEGRCWHSYKYTNDTIKVTGLLTEPNNRIMKVVIWGYGTTDHVWKVYSIDFQKAIKTPCKEQDYEDWIPHAEMTHPSGETKWKGCLLGVKETFKRLKKDSWCSNGQSYMIKRSPVYCPCTKDNYECEYGYSRPLNKYNCVRNPLIKELDSCIKGDLTKILTSGYRKLPGDECKNGFIPNPTKQVSLKKVCKNDEKGIDFANKPESKKTLSNKTKPFDKSLVVWIVAGICFVLIAAVLIVVMVSRYHQLKRRHVNYKYSLLNTHNDETFDTSVDVGLLSDQNGKDAPTVVNRIEVHSNIEGAQNPIVRPYHDDSDVDILE